MKPRPWFKVGKLLLCGSFWLAAAVVTAQEPPAATPPIRVNTTDLPDVPAQLPLPRRLSPASGRSLNIPDVDVDHRATAAREESLPFEPPAPEAPKPPTGGKSSDGGGEAPVRKPSPTLAKKDGAGAGYQARKQSSGLPPANPYPSAAPPKGDAGEVVPARVPDSPPPTEPPNSWPVVAPPPGPYVPGQPIVTLPFAPPGIDWQHLTDVYVRVDGGVHRDAGFPEREGMGFEIDGRLRLPDAPCFSLVGELRYDAYFDYSDRLAWTLGGIVEQDLLQVAFGIDGVYDWQGDSYVGSGFIMVAQDLPSWHSRIGVWSTVELWDDTHTYLTFAGPFARITTVGVAPVEQTAFFYAARLGPNCRWGEAYVAPGFEHNEGQFRLSLGYQGTITGPLDGYAQFAKTFNGQDDWLFFAGLQYHFGCGTARPFDFVMPQRIRARGQVESSSVVTLRDLLP